MFAKIFRDLSTCHTTRFSIPAHCRPVAVFAIVVVGILLLFICAKGSPCSGPNCQLILHPIQCAVNKRGPAVLLGHVSGPKMAGGTAGSVQSRRWSGPQVSVAGGSSVLLCVPKKAAQFRLLGCFACHYSGTKRNRVKESDSWDCCTFYLLCNIM